MMSVRCGILVFVLLPVVKALLSFLVKNKNALSLSLFLVIGPYICPADDLHIGSSTALTGPAKALGTSMTEGMKCYFDIVNKSGGIAGRKIKLHLVDDGYEPMRCAPNIRKLIDNMGVIAVAGNVGTPTAVVSVPIVNEKKVLLFGAFTGAGLLRKTPPDRYVINFRASYAEETASMIGGLLNEAGIKPEEIAFFTQNDGYGNAGYKGAVTALRKHGFNDGESLPHGRYTRNTLNVEGALVDILQAEVRPKAIIMVGAYKPCAAFIKLAKKEGLNDVLFLNVSFVGSKALAKELGKDGEGVIVTQVVPHFNSDVPIAHEYRKNFKKPYGFVSLEGYIVAKSIVLGLKNAGRFPTREKLVDALERLDTFDLGLGVNISLSKTKHQMCHMVWPTKIKNGKYVSFSWEELK